MTGRARGRFVSAHRLLPVPGLLLAMVLLAPAPAAGQQAVQAQGAATQHPPHRHLRGTRQDFAISSVTPAGSIEAGHGGTAAVVITRAGGHTAAVTLSIVSNAPGITGSGTIASGSTSGTLNINVPASASAAGTHALTMDATDGSHTHSAGFSQTVTVTPAVISSFTATPPVISAGQSSTLAYSFTGGTGSIDNGVGSVISGATTIVSPTVTTTYTLTVTPPIGPTVQRQASVTVASGNATMSNGRAYHSETLLPNGKVLLVGGVPVLSLFGSWSVTGTADLFDPASGLLNPTGSLGTARWAHTATLLNNGKVLIAGGFYDKTNGTPTAELYDPATGLFTATSGQLHFARGGHTATLLPDGKVLIVGGYSGKTNNIANYPAQCEVYDPVANSFDAPTGLLLNNVRGGHRATPIYNTSFPAAAAVQALGLINPPENRVLISGGYSAAGFVTPLEWYLVGSSTFTTGTLPSLIGGRVFHTAVLLPNNKVLLAGGGDKITVPVSAVTTAELYDVAANTIAATGSLSSGRAAQTSTLVNGKVLVAGGITGYGGLLGGAIYTTIESYDPATAVFTTLGATMAAGRAFQTATLLGNGTILFAGGVNASASGYILNSVEQYSPPSP
jgi:hypothetical protein